MENHTIPVPNSIFDEEDSLDSGDEDFDVEGYLDGEEELTEADRAALRIQKDNENAKNLMRMVRAHQYEEAMKNHVKWNTPYCRKHGKRGETAQCTCQTDDLCEPEKEFKPEFIKWLFRCELNLEDFAQKELDLYLTEARNLRRSYEHLYIHWHGINQEASNLFTDITDKYEEALEFINYKIDLVNKENVRREKLVEKAQAELDNLTIQ